MAPKVYYYPRSTACRAVFATAKTLGLTLDLHELDPEKGELTSPEYLKLNPLHKVPTLTDGNIVICDSHAINAYLVGKYGKDDSLYPKDVVKKAAVDEKLYFEAASLAAALFGLLGDFKAKEIKTVPERKAKYVLELYGVLDKFLENGQWVAGDKLTIADFSIYTTLTCIEYLVPLDSKKFTKVAAWVQKVKTLPCFEGDQKQIDLSNEWLKGLLA